MMTRKWLPEEDKKLVELWRRNYNTNAICSILKRSKNGIRKRIERIKNGEIKYAD